MGTSRDAEQEGRLRVAALVLATLGLAWLLVQFVVLAGSPAWGYDYRAYADAALRLGETGSLYQVETLSGPFRPGPFGLYMYAPPLGIAVTPLTGLGVDAGIAGWYVLHVLALAVACAVMPVRPAVRLAAFGMAALSLAVTRDLVLGNVSVLLLLPTAIAWRWLDRPIGSMAQALAIAVRPMLGMLLVWQLLRRQWRAVAWTLGAGLLLVVLSLPFVGVAGYVDYLTVLRNLGDATGVTRNYDLGSTVLAAGVGQGMATLALLAGYAVAIGAMLWSLRRDREVGFMVTLTGSLLLSPLLWDHYLALLVLPAAFLANRGRTWALALPLLAWLPPVTYPAVVLAATLLPFLARDPESSPESVSDGQGAPLVSPGAPA